MIVKEIRPGATPQGLDGVTRKFTIEANGIAFRSLIDSLYSNKVLAVIRELCSNAMDSHIEAGQSAPFDVSIPTHLEPTFTVRDYGVGLSHENVFGLYTTIFQSSKRETNEQTGQLGLGSKSPFAYTDSFSVKSYSGFERRVYLAHLATDGVPALTHVSTTASTEPRGLEVTFAVKREDIPAFQKEMQFVSMGYDASTLNVMGMTVKVAEPRIKGTNWAIYPANAFGDLQSNHFIRQGSALYPSQRAFPHVGHGWVTITTIPIGTASVTSSRDALSYDEDTRVAVSTIHNDAYLELKAYVDGVVAAAKTRIEVAKVYAEYNGILDNLRGSTMVSIGNKDDMDQPGDTLEMAMHFGKPANGRNQRSRWASAFDYTTLDKIRVVINEPGTYLVRKTKRIRNFGYSQFNYVLSASGSDIEEAIAWLKECLELDDSQFVNVADLPDDPPVRTPRVPGAPRVKKVLKPGQSWLLRADAVVQTEHYGHSARGTEELPGRLTQAMRLAGLWSTFNWDDVFWVNRADHERLSKKGLLPEDRRLDNVVKAKLEADARKAPIDDALTLQAIRRYVGEYNRALPIVMAQFFPNIKITQSQAEAVINLAEYAKFDLRNRPIVDKIEAEIKALIETYPLLFQKSEPDHFTNYINAIKATTGKR